MNEHDTIMAWVKITVAWIGLVVGGVTLSNVALTLTIAFTALQIYKLIRELRREKRMETLEARLKHADAGAAEPIATVRIER